MYVQGEIIYKDEHFWCWDRKAKICLKAIHFLQKIQLVFEVAKKVGNKYHVHVCTSVKNDSFPQSWS